MNRKFRPKSSSRPRPRLHRRGRDNARTAKAVALLSGVGITVAALLIMGGARPEPPRLADGCLKDGALPAIEMALIDATEPFDRFDAQKMTEIIRRRSEELPVEGRLSLTVLQPDSRGERLREMFARCRPRDGSKVHALYENPDRIVRAYQESFARPLTATLDGLRAMGGADTSPILETLYAASSAFEREASAKHLLVVSDLLEFSLVNMYRSYRWDDVARHPRVAAMGGRLEGVEVTVLLRMHPNRRLQAGRHSAFWQAYFRHAGVRTLHIRPL